MESTFSLLCHRQASRTTELLSPVLVKLRRYLCYVALLCPECECAFCVLAPDSGMGCRIRGIAERSKVASNSLMRHKRLDYAEGKFEFEFHSAVNETQRGNKLILSALD